MMPVKHARYVSEEFITLNADDFAISLPAVAS